MWNNWDYGEKGAVFGLLIGIYLFFMSYLFEYEFQSKFSLGIEINGKIPYVRYISLLPLLLAIIGLLMGKIIDKFSKNKKNSLEKLEKKSNMDRLVKARENVEKARKKGFSDKQITSRFKKAGWSEDQIKRVM